jgi:hypothetical protein
MKKIKLQRKKRPSPLDGMTAEEIKLRSRTYQREYHRLYYHENKERLSTYQRDYKRNGNKPPVKDKVVESNRPAYRTFKPLDIQQLDPMKVEKNWNRILA